MSVPSVIRLTWSRAGEYMYRYTSSDLGQKVILFGNQPPLNLVVVSPRLYHFPRLLSLCNH